MPAGLPPPVVVAQPARKCWWKSRMLWLNAGVLALTVAETQLNVLQPLIPVNVYALVAFGLPILNAVLRLVTTQGLQLKTPGSEP